MSNDPLANLKLNAERLEAISLRALFTDDEERFSCFSRNELGLLYDFSKEKLDKQAFQALIAFAQERQLEKWRDEFFAGFPINASENRAALHMALRGQTGDSYQVMGQPVMESVLAARTHMLSFAEAVRKGAVTASDGGSFHEIVNIGIGGSDLGPRMAARALLPFHDGPRLHFVSNIDGADITDTLASLDPARTLFLIASKTFTTSETMTNAKAALHWVESMLGQNKAGSHFAALSSNLEAAKAFGVAGDRIFPFDDWVGGRFSIWSSIGLSLAIAVGAEHFNAFLGGARLMDKHFRSASYEENLPTIAGLIGFWRRECCRYSALAVIPYDERLALLPDYLQQLVMESNGKRVSRDGSTLETKAAPVLFGSAGTDAQHSFFQMLHQGTEAIPADFMIAAQALNTNQTAHTLLQSNCFAQSQALAFGRSADFNNSELLEAPDPVPSYRECPGNRPSTTLIYESLSPATLGKIIAFWEHKTFVEAVLYDINPFDQWGVEIGKSLAHVIHQAFSNSQERRHLDASTQGLIGHVLTNREPK